MFKSFADPTERTSGRKFATYALSGVEKTAVLDCGNDGQHKVSEGYAVLIVCTKTCVEQPSLQVNAVTLPFDHPAHGWRRAGWHHGGVASPTRQCLRIRHRIRQ